MLHCIVLKHAVLIPYSCVMYAHDLILLIPFQQVDAVLRAATSIVNSGKLKKLFKVILFNACPVVA